MADLEPMIIDLALILVVAGIVTLIFKRLKQPLVLGYIVAGFLVSPHMPYTASVADVENVHLWADIGVMFLLFSLGLDFSFKKIIKMGISPVISAVCVILPCHCWASWLDKPLAGRRWTAFSSAVCWPCLPPLLYIRPLTTWDFVIRSLPAW
jgi:Kef-type K+ transport system membrane component KefB